ncbi:TrbG/VirB9 family P-type conjugative transfer protein [Erythrobacteraceae bacterium E2-1 Yellow Sea]|nr:TrbG/VirB9 family P-type conjugative transfer protein [Erythrobacteraceae bacterium E2-1 Yellow Sea]
MIRAAIAAFALAATVQPALAEDPRLVERPYDPAAVVRVNGKANVQATIKFSDDEVIENVAIGDSQSWQVTPNKRANLLFVKPLTSTANTNMTVVTSRRTYLFDMVATPRNNPLYVLSFTYADEPEDEAQLAAVETANEAEMTAAGDPFAVVDPAALNFEWNGEGNPSLLPARMFDNGEATFLSWPAGSAVPAILVRDEKGTEGPVNYTVRGDTIIVDGVPSAIILRSGQDIARIYPKQPSERSNRKGDGALAKVSEKRK